MYHRLDARPDVRMDQDSSNRSKGSYRGQPGKARAMAKSQVPQGSKAIKGASPSWVDGEVCLDRNILMEELLKNPAGVNAFCWL